MSAYTSISIRCREAGRAAVHGFPFNLQGLSELSNMFCETKGVGVVSAEVLDLALKGGIVLLSSSVMDCPHFLSSCALPIW